MLLCSGENLSHPCSTTSEPLQLHTLTRSFMCETDREKFDGKTEKRNYKN